MSDNKEEYHPHYEVGAQGLGLRLPETDGPPTDNIPISDSVPERNFKNDPLIAIVIILALVLIGLAFASGLLKV